MTKPLSRLVFLILILTLTGAECIRFGGGTGEGAAGGVFKSVLKGEEWVHKVAVPTATGVRNFGGANIITLTIDPQDHLALYAGTRENGLFYSYDGGESWNQAKALASGFVSTIAVDPKNKCTIYAATGNRILKSTDCNRTFTPIYNEAAPLTSISALAISPFNSAVLYAGTTKGALIKSVDSGNTWSIQGNVRNRVVDLVLDPRASITVYAAVEGRGVWRSSDDGKTFKDMSAGLKKIKDANVVRRLIADRATGSGLLLASKHKISRSVDGGVTWAALPIISPETVEILALAVNPRDSKELYYGTATTFYRSSDGGERWSADKLPTKRQASALLVDLENPAVIYLGAMEVKK